jgi:hypothetical protein
VPSLTNLAKLGDVDNMSRFILLLKMYPTYARGAPFYLLKKGKEKKAWKVFQEQTLQSVTKKKSFITLTHGVPRLYVRGFSSLHLFAQSQPSFLVRSTLCCFRHNQLM